MNCIHTIQKWLRNGIERIGCCDENDATQIDRHVQVVVLEGVILLRVKHLEHGSGWIAMDAHTTTKFVELVKKHHTV